MDTGTVQAPEWAIVDVIGVGAGEIEAYRGRPLLILFWSIGCTGCTGRAIPYTRKVAERYPALQIVAIHSEFNHAKKRTPGEVRAIAEYFRLPYPVLIDDEVTTFDTYQAVGTPHWVLVGGGGTVRGWIFGSMPESIQRLDNALVELFDGAEKG